MNKEQARMKAEKRFAWAIAAQDRAKKIQEELNADPRYTDQQFWLEPIKVGHHSERRHRRARDTYMAKEKRIIDLLDKAKDHREKAQNLLYFANRNKGDAEKKREQERVQADSVYTVGSSINDFAYGAGEVLKVNKKTYTVRFRLGFTCTRDKSYFI